MAEENLEYSDAYYAVADDGFIETPFGRAYCWHEVEVYPMPPNAVTGIYGSMEDVRHHRYNKRLVR